MKIQTNKKARVDPLNPLRDLPIGSRVMVIDDKGIQHETVTRSKLWRNPSQPWMMSLAGADKGFPADRIRVCPDYEYVAFPELDRPEGLNREYGVLMKERGMVRGRLMKYLGSGEYEFLPDEDTVWTTGELAEITSYLKLLKLSTGNLKPVASSL